MATEKYNGLEWEIGEFPVAFSTPDEFFENDFNATTECPHCGGEVTGIAHYWSEDEHFVSCWLERIDYEEECERCGEMISEEETLGDDDDDDEFENDFAHNL